MPSEEDQLPGLIPARNSSSALQTILSGKKCTPCSVLFFRKTWKLRRKLPSFHPNRRSGVALMSLSWRDPLIYGSEESSRTHDIAKSSKNINADPSRL